MAVAEPIVSRNYFTRFNFPRQIKSHHHGTLTGFSYGCRCSDCKAAWQKQDRERKAAERTADPDVVNARQRTRRSKSPEQYRAMDRVQHRRTTYGLEPSDIKRILSMQNMRCPMCQKILEFADIDAEVPIFGFKVSIDHCHKNGDVRGIPCRDCNLGLGHFKDDVAALTRAIEYLALADLRRDVRFALGF